MSGADRRSTLRDLFLVALFAALSGLSGLFVVPPLDRDESRFVQATTQMIETGDYVRIRFQDEERNKKPVGIHWLQAASVSMLADVEDRPLWAYRLPSLLGAVLAALFTYWAGCTLFGRRAGIVAALLLASAPIVAAEASIAKTDAALLGAVCCMQAALASLWANRKGRLGPALGFWIALGAGVLIKGPIAPLIAALTVGTLAVAGRRRGLDWLRRLRPLTGLLVLGLMLAPWFVAIGVVTDGRFYAEAIGTDMLGKVGAAQERHAGPPGYHLLLLPLLFWPASLVLPAALRWAAGARAAPSVLFCLAWLVPAWLVFELSSTKLPHYPMVAYPALALLAGGFLTSGRLADFKRWRWGSAVLYALVGLVAAAAGPALLAQYRTGGVPAWSFGLSGLVLLGTLGALLLARTAPLRAGLVASATSAGLAWVLFQAVLPSLDVLAVSPRLSAFLESEGVHPRLDGAPDVSLAGYSEPSAVFLLGTTTRLTDGAGAAVWLGTSGHVAVVERRALPDVTETRATVLGSVTGLNYSNGKTVELIVLRAE
ncbi:ArnT family glycosyltransferase [Parvularcula dongshanensis]|uniref:4-amino-4-deoxy-L-arabinose transferase-like glycosyltransferase n=1 Tax=Parvularcula dongshanensis TaxID=1173995 RepID=A0A840I068_9PROT|nr:glycosyltransferase family 39 protein [Parvularcula dongshanensis]MBB4658219.1 4-amino-4-deoxy-L-arabinose transferase-like glycosyltransferase [Parvularcula dongshanensis]